MLREENLRLQRRLLRETERREQLSRQLSESESSLEMDEERQFNERARYAGSPVSYSPSPTRRFLHYLSSGPMCIENRLSSSACFSSNVATFSVYRKGRNYYEEEIHMYSYE